MCEICGNGTACVKVQARDENRVIQNSIHCPTATVRVLGIGNTSSSSGWGGITPAASTLDVTARPSTGKAGKITRLTLPTAGKTTAWQDLAIAAGDGIIPATPVTAYPAGTTLDIDACIIGEQPYFDGGRLPATLPE